MKNQKQPTGSTSENYWNRLNPRERMLIQVMVALAIIVGSIFLVLKPGEQANASARNRRALAQDELVMVRELAKQVTDARTQMASVSLSDIATFARGAAADVGVSIDRELSQANALEYRLSGPSSAAILSWAELLCDTFSVSIDQLTLERTGSVLFAEVHVSRVNP